MRKPNGYWTYEKCKEEALKYENKNDFKKYSGSANHMALKKKWMDEICSHMKIIAYKQEYWTKETCKKRALLCKSRSEFHIKYRAAFNTSSKNNWLNDICSHMKPIDKKKRCIYAYEFDDNSVYIGLTYNLNNRHNRHMNKYNTNGSVYKYIKISNLTPKLKQLTNYLKIENAKIKEKFYVKKYKNENWKILNKIKTGGIGGITIKWSKEKCQEKALLCKTKSEFYKKYSSASSSALKNGWMYEICLHMDHPTKQRGYWNNYENCLTEAKKLKILKTFRLNASGAYKSIMRNNWKEKLYLYMNWI